MFPVRQATTAAKAAVSEDIPWEVAHADHEGKAKYRPDNLDYKCFCVKPILETEVTVDKEKYTVRYQLCGQGSCDITNVPEVDTEMKKHQDVKCFGKCEGECKCTLFRLQVSGDDKFKPEKAEWELVAKADTLVRHDSHYIYRCFCLK